MTPALAYERMKQAETAMHHARRLAAMYATGASQAAAIYAAAVDAYDAARAGESARVQP